jgi:hypothetical protein
MVGQVEVKAWEIVMRVAIQVIAIMPGLLTVVAVTLGGAIVAGFLYNVTHAIPDPVVRGDDLGNGFVALFGLVIGFLVSVPSSLLIYRLVVSRLSKRMDRK